MKKKLALLLALVMIVALAVPVTASAEPATEITLWTYPVGNYGDQATVQALTDAFTAETGIKVTVEYLTYADGDDKVNTAITANQAPDLIMEGPERLVSNWGANGYMVDISDMFDDTDKSEINAAALKACFAPDGAAYEYPLVMTAHCMAVNVNALEEAGVKDLVDLESHTWTVDQFKEVVKALNETYGLVGAVYCSGQGGDQGTRALAMNLFSASFTNPEHNSYTMDSENGLKGLQLLVDLCKEGVLEYDPGIVAGDEIALFCNSTLSMGFCWNASAAESNRAVLAEDVKVFPMAFPSDDGIPELCGGIWGFGIFDNGDAAKAEAAKTFIRFVCDDAVQGPASVYASGFFPVRASFGDIYAGTEKAANADYAIFMPYLGDYYNVISGWATQRTEWWNMLQRIFAGGDVAAEVGVYIDHSNAAIGQ